MKKFLVCFAVFAAMVFFVACGDGVKFNNPNDPNTDVTDSSDSQNDEDKDSANTENPDKKQGELYGECYPNKTCNDGLICDKNNNICIKDSESPENNDDESDSDSDDDSDTTSDNADSAPDNDADADSGDSTPDQDADSSDTSLPDNDTDIDSGDSTPDNDTDTDTTPSDPCTPNPCLSVANSTQECIVFGITYKCVCNQDYFWDGSVCGTVQTQTVPCTDLPVNAEWNTADTITQTWDDYLGTWIPSSTGSYNENPSSEQCRFKCKENYGWYNSECVPTLECSASSGTPCRDSSSGLIWSAKSSSSWSNAKYICSSYTGSGLSGWHLPTIDELRTLILKCESTMPGGNCGVTDSCLSSDCRNSACSGCSEDLSGDYSKFGDTDKMWSSSYIPDPELELFGLQNIYTVDFSYGDVSYGSGLNSDLSSIYHYFRCVR